MKYGRKIKSDVSKNSFCSQLFQLKLPINYQPEKVCQNSNFTDKSSFVTSQTVVYLDHVEEAKRNQIPVFKLKPGDLDSCGDIDFSSFGDKLQTRGGMVYKQPSEKWIRVGLRVSGRYDQVLCKNTFLKK